VIDTLGQDFLNTQPPPSATDIARTYIFIVTGQQPAAADDGNDLEITPAAMDQMTQSGGEYKIDVANIDLTTKEGRAMFRAKLAQTGIQFSDMLGKAHPGAGPTPGGIDTKPEGDLAKVELLQETHKAVEDLANLPPKVRKEAEDIAKLVSSGALPADRVDELVAHGVDPAAVQYYKKYWAEAKDPKATEFATKLTQEHEKAKQAKQEENTKVRIKRAYDLAYEMRDKGVIPGEQVSSQVENILSWNDEAFENVKSMVGRQAIQKQASVPNVGMLSSGDVYLPSAEGQSQESVDIKSEFDTYFGDEPNVAKH
jgi:hypothetical protein